MTAMQLPAHLQGRQSTGAAARATEGMGSSLPPHISIQGNKFTFIDASGQAAAPMLQFYGYIVDFSEHMCKRYYDKPFDPGANSYEPPACWSANGIGPSREAAKPQCDRCEVCPQNERGSAVSRISNAAIKACRDERWVAIMAPHQFGNMVFQLVVPPGSFKNWKSFMVLIENYKIDPWWTVASFSFEDKTNGVLKFDYTGHMTDEQTMQLIEAARAEKKTDLIVGRLDQPRTAALPGPAQPTAAALPPNQFAQPAANVVAQLQPGAIVNSGMTAADPRGFAPQQEVIPPGAPQAPFGAPSAATPFGQPTPAMGSPSAQPAFSPSPQQTEPASVAQAQPTTRRRRNSAAPAAPAQNGAGGAPVAPFAPGPAPTGFAPVVPPGLASTAAFAPPGAPGPGNNFGIGGGAEVNPEMSAMLANIFKPAG